MKKILLFMVYYGKLPNYFNIWLKAAEYNDTIDFCIITDCLDEYAKLPENVQLFYWPYEQFKNRIQDKFDFTVSIKNYGRISQFRPAFAYVFPEKVKGYDYWGFIECDLIPGNIRAFISDEILESHDKIFKLGHFQIFKNNKKMNTLFMQKAKSALDYKFAFGQNVLFFEELLGMHNLAEAKDCKTYSENIFADIKCYEYMFCRSPYGYSQGNVEKKCLCEFNNGKIYCFFLNDYGKLQKEEVLYVHLQKRDMEINTVDYEKYLIIPNQFARYQKITEELFNSVNEATIEKEEEYRLSMMGKLNKARKKRYKEFCWWRLKLIRRRIKKNGGVDLNGK